MKKFSRLAACLLCLAVSSCSISSAQSDTDFYDDPEYRAYGDRPEDIEFQQREEFEGGNRYKMNEAVHEMGFEYNDQIRIMNHVEGGGAMNADGLRESRLSDEAWEQIRDDARFN